MGEEFNDPNNNNDHFWNFNHPTSPNSDGFNSFSLDFPQPTIENYIDSSFDANPHIEFDPNDQEPSIPQFPDFNSDPFGQITPEVDKQFGSDSIFSQNAGENHNNQIEDFNQIQLTSNQQFSPLFSQQINLPAQPSTNLNRSMNHIRSNLSMNIGPKANSTSLFTNTHRRTPSTPSSIFGINFTLQNLQQAQKQQPQKISQLTAAQIQQMAQFFNQDISLPQSRNRKMSSQPLPVVPNITTSADEEFNTICQDHDIKFNPHKLGFIPTKFWPDKDYTFGELVSDFFQRKNNANSRFYHKLYNALKISEDDPFYSEYLGIEWIGNNVLKVDKKKFARLLNIKTIDGSLFHQQGNFPSHGFIEIGSNDARNYVSEDDLNNVDYENVRLLIHQNGVFIRGCTEESIEKCKWVSSRKRH